MAVVSHQCTARVTVESATRYRRILVRIQNMEPRPASSKYTQIKATYDSSNLWYPVLKAMNGVPTEGIMTAEIADDAHRQSKRSSEGKRMTDSTGRRRQHDGSNREGRERGSGTDASSRRQPPDPHRRQETGGGLTPAGPPLFESPSCNHLDRQRQKYHAKQGVAALSALVPRAAVRKRTQQRIDRELASRILTTATRHV